MADIRITSTGEIVYRIDNGVAKLLIHALPSVFEHAGESPMPEAQPQKTDQQKALRGLSVELGMGADAQVPRVAEPRWSLFLLPTGRHALQLEYGASSYKYDGPPENAQKAFGQEIPADVLATYKKQYKPR